VKQSIIHIALVVRDYDEAIAFFCHKLHFTLTEDSYQPEQDKRWVLVTPPWVDRGQPPAGSGLNTRAAIIHWQADRGPGIPVPGHG